MKTNFLKYILFLCLFSIAVGSCKKDDVKPNREKEEVKDKEEGSNEESEGSIRLYKVSGEVISKIKDYKVTRENLKYQKDNDKHKQMWKLVKGVIPQAKRGLMSEFLIFNGEDEGGTAGWVVPKLDNLKKWQMGLAIDYAFEGGFNADGEFAYTVIHEFGHIITLNNAQVDPDIKYEDSKTFFTGEGSARLESYIYKLYKAYWADIYEEFTTIGEEDEEKHEAFYQKYKDRFVTQYAATNPGEDIAETFTYFVVLSDKPNGNTIADKKVRMMYQFPELVEIRDYIRKTNNLKSSDGSFIVLPEPGSWRNANQLGNPKKTHN